MAQEAVKGVVILMILERLYLTSNASWLEARAVPRACPACWLTQRCSLVAPRQQHLDYLSIQSLLLKRNGLNLVDQIRTIWHHQKRLS